MHIVFLTYGLTKHNGRLMPWRYVLEIAQGIVETGNNATVLTDSNHESTQLSDGLPAIEGVGGCFSTDNPRYRDCIGKIKPDVMYVPVARRSAISQKVSFPERIPHFGYFPSAWYNPKDTWAVSKDLPFRDACIYTLESLIPGSCLVKTLQQRGFAGIVTVTEYTARKLGENGWPESMMRALPPGIDLFQQSGKTPEIFNKNLSRIKGKQYLLFMGPPTAIRGVYFLLKAFGRVANLLDNVALVCLVRRSGDGSEVQKVERTVKELKHADRVILIEEKLTEEDIIGFIKESRAVILPFLIVPSEIPLAVIESMILGKPVIVTETGGTSEFVGKAGKIVRQNDINALSESIKEVFSNEAGYITMCEEAKKIIRGQRQWNQVAESLVDFTADTLSALSKPIGH